MNDYMATFHTHLSAMRSQRTLSAGGVQARLSPVPRSLSASCGTCVRYRADTPCLDALDADMELDVRQLKEGEYERIAQNE